MQFTADLVTFTKEILTEKKLHFLRSATIHSFLQSKYSYEFSQNLYEKELYEEEIPAQVFSCAYCEIL